ncbi:hypothetical protein PM01_15955 [Sulfitobacter pontiacus 3SOLIMAR09]|nr:hypothetical protein PM01_15955 [Sulfitobacter pontiacus 3SOLIMAR09]
MDVGIVQDDHIVLDTHAGAPRSTYFRPIFLRQFSVGLGHGYSRVIEMTLKSRTQLGNLIEKLDCDVGLSANCARDNGHCLSLPPRMVNRSKEVTNRRSRLPRAGYLSNRHCLTRFEDGKPDAMQLVFQVPQKVHNVFSLECVMCLDVLGIVGDCVADFAQLSDDFSL